MMETLSTYAQPFFSWLLRTTIQASVVICLILLIQAAFRNRLTARWHYALWMILVVRMVLPWAPQSRISIYNFATWQRKSNVPASVPPEPDAEPAKTPGGASVAPQPTVGSGPAGTTEGQDRRLPVLTGTSRASTDLATNTMLRLSGVLPFLWLAGALLLGGYIVICNLRLWRAASVECPSTDKETLELLEKCRAAIGLRTIVALVPSETINTPILLGFVRPRLLVPKSMAEKLNREELRYIFLHELAHVKRHDIAIGWLTTLLQVVHWFNPFIWLAFHRMRSNRESACDAFVLSRMQGEKTQNYGRAIVSLLEHFSVPQPLPGLAGILETKSQLKRRIAMITQFKNNSYHWSPLAVIVMILLACVSLPDARYTQASAFSAVEPAGATSDAQRTSLVVREVKIKQGESGLSLSRDGKQLVYPKRKDGMTNLVVRDLASGEETQVTKYETGTARYPVFSPDGKEIVYTRTQGMRNQKLHIVSLETGEDRDLGQYGFAKDWSKDGSLILFSPWQVEDKQTTYDMLSLSEGMVKELNVPISRSLMGPPRFSPDAKYISYPYRGKVYLYHVDNGDVVRITQGPAASQPLWSLDGKMLFFLSPQAFGPEADLCGVPIADGKAVGGVQIIKPDFGDYVNLISLSDTGRLLYRQYHFEGHSYSTEVDPQTNQPIGKPVKLVDGGRATWSPDGKRIAYISGALHVMSADGSNDRKIINVNPFKGPYAWAPDNDHIYIVERVEDRAGIYSISISAKERRPVFLDPDIMGHLTCSPDGKRLAFLKLPASSGKPEIFTVNVDGSNLKQLTSNKDMKVMYPAWSPDGKYIAFNSKRQGEDMRALRVISVDDGKIQELFRGETPGDQFLWASWFPNGSKVAWTSSGEIRIGQVSDGKYDTFRVDIGTPAKSTFHMPCLSPNGKKILFSTWANVQHLMLMENFLPQPEKAPGVVTRLVWPIGADLGGGKPSPDGHYLTFVDPQTGDVGLRELSTGKSHLLTHEGSRLGSGQEQERAFWPQISPDDERVVYTWSSGGHGWQLRVVGIDGSKPRIVYPRKDGHSDDEKIYPLTVGWLPDRKHILVYQTKHSSDKSIQNQILLIPLTDGPIRILKTLSEEPANNRPERRYTMSLSPDGHYLAYSREQPENPSNRDIFLLPLDGTEETALVTRPKDDYVLGWAPDGQRLLFAERRGRRESWDAWIVRIVDGKPQGSPELVRPNIGLVRPIGVTRDGSFYYVLHFPGGRLAVHTAQLDLETGKVVSLPAPVKTRALGASGEPTWSPDGKFLAYWSSDGVSYRISILLMETGQVRQLDRKLNFYGALRWSPDGQSILTTAQPKPGGPFGVFQIDTQTGDAKTLVEPGQGAGRAAWSPDGKGIFFVKDSGIVFRDLQTSSDKEILPHDRSGLDPVLMIDVSPDGQQVAVYGQETKSKAMVLKVIPASGGEPRELLRLEKESPNRQPLAWTRDGQSLLLIRSGSEETRGLWRIPIDGGKCQRLELPWTGWFMDLSVHPDGQRIAFVADQRRKEEVWVMENFLPERMGK